MTMKKGASSGLGGTVAKATARAQAKLADHYVAGTGPYAAPPSHPEVAPTPAATHTTGTEHLSGTQFSGAQFRAKPAGNVSSMLPGAAGASHGSVKRVTPMHPGGAGMGGPKFVSTPAKSKPSSYSPTGGNSVASGKSGYTRMGSSASTSGQAQSSGAAYWAGLGMGGGTAPPKGPRGNPKPMGGSPAGRARKGSTGPGRARGKGRVGGAVRTVLQLHKTRHEGKLSEHLKKATGSK